MGATAYDRCAPAHAPLLLPGRHGLLLGGALMRLQQRSAAQHSTAQHRAGHTALKRHACLQTQAAAAARTRAQPHARRP
jgi:hypothetical protein